MRVTDCDCVRKKSKRTETKSQWRYVRWLSVVRAFAPVFWWCEKSSSDQPSSNKMMILLCAVAGWSFDIFPLLLWKENSAIYCVFSPFVYFANSSLLSIAIIIQFYLLYTFFSILLFPVLLKRCEFVPLMIYFSYSLQVSITKWTQSSEGEKILKE